MPGNAPEVARATVTIIPSMEGAQQSISEQLGAASSSAGTAAGKKAGSAFSSGMGTALKTAGVAVAAVGTAVATGSKAFLDAANTTAQYGDNVDKMSQKLGLSANAYQEWDYVLKLAGTEMSSMTTGLKTLTNKLDDAKNGSEDAQEMFSKLGISMDDISTMSREDLFAKTIAGFQGMADSTDRAALANDLFGKSGQNLAPLFNQSAEATKALIKEAHNYGMVLSDEGVKASADFEDSLTRMQGTLNGLKTGMMSEFLPALTSIMDGFSAVASGDESGLDKISEGVTALVDNLTNLAPKMMQVGVSIITSLATAITTNLPTLLQAAVPIIMQLADGLIQNLPMITDVAFQIVMELVNGIAQALPNLIPEVVEIMLTIVDNLIQNIPMLISAANDIVLGLVEGITQALPILIAALPDIIVGVIDALLQSLPILIQGTIQLVTGLVQAMPQIIQALIEAAPQILTGIIGALVANAPMLVDAFIQLFAAVGSSWGDITMMLIQSIPQSFVEIANAFMALGPILVDTFNQIMTMVGPTFNQLGIEAQTAWAAIQQAFANVGEWFRQKFTAASNGVKNAFNNVKTFFQNLWKSIQQVFSDAVSKFTSIGSDIANGILKGLSGSWANLKAFLQKACGDLIALAKRILGIASPSKEFAKQVGQWIPAGIAQGIQNGMGVLNKEIKNMTDDMLVGTIRTTTEAASSINFIPDSSSIEAGRSVVINNNIRVDGAQDPEAWTQTFISTLKREARMA